MSGILKPNISFASSTTPDEIVNVDHVKDMSILNVPHTPPRVDGSIKHYSIIFIMDNSDQPIEIKFLAEVDRDNGLAAYNTAATVAV